jgi:hypothetical protein
MCKHVYSIVALALFAMIALASNLLAPTWLVELRQQHADEEMARRKFDHEMRPAGEAIDAQFTAADRVPLAPVPERVRGLVRS